MQNLGNAWDWKMLPLIEDKVRYEAKNERENRISVCGMVNFPTRIHLPNLQVKLIWKQASIYQEGGYFSKEVE